MQSEASGFAPSCRTGRNIRVVFDYGLFSTIYENMASSTKPEMLNLSHCFQRRTESRPQVTCTYNFVKLGNAVFEIRKRTDRQTDKQTDKQTYKHADHNTLHLRSNEHDDDDDDDACRLWCVSST